MTPPPLPLPTTNSSLIPVGPPPPPPPPPPIVLVNGENLGPDVYKACSKFDCWRLQQLEHVREYAHGESLVDRPTSEVLKNESIHKPYNKVILAPYQKLCKELERTQTMGLAEKHLQDNR